MKKLLVSLAAFAAVGSASAATSPVLIDNFNSPDVAISATVGNSATSANDGTRSVQLSSVGAFGNTAVDIGSLAGGFFSLANTAFANSTTVIEWTPDLSGIPATATNISFFFDVISSDKVSVLNFTSGATGLSTRTIPVTNAPQAYSFGLDPAEWAIVSSSSTLKLTITGQDEGLDLVLDSFGFSFIEPTAVVPEPGSLALVGLALAGIAAARRRKA